MSSRIQPAPPLPPSSPPLRVFRGGAGKEDRSKLASELRRSIRGGVRSRRVSGYNLDELLPERGFHVA